MKKTPGIYVLLIFIISACSSQYKESDLTGHWGITVFDTKQTHGLSQALIKEAEKVALNSTYTFFADQTFTSNIHGERNEGQWSYHPKSRILTMKGLTENSNEQWKIKKWNKREIQATQSLQPHGFLQITLSKIAEH